MQIQSEPTADMPELDLTSDSRHRYLRNCWYVIAWGHEVADRPFARTILDEPIVLYRGEDGSLNALADRCPHRFAPLNRGRVIGSTLACGYHGLVFDGSGTCTLNPHGNNKIPAKARVKSYPTIERYKLIWIWMGDSKVADDTKIPDYEWMVDGSHVRNAGSYLHGQANYLLFIDNLLDLSHAQYLHPLFGNDAMAKSTVTIEQNGNQVWARRFIPNEPATPRFVPLLGLDPATPVDHWLDTRWDAPGALRLNVGVTPAGRERKAGVEIVATHIVSPETEFSSHYFFSHARSFRMDEEELTRQGTEIAYRVFSTEDLPMLEDQQTTMGTADLLSLGPIFLSSDGGATRVRRILAEMIEAESRARR